MSDNPRTSGAFADATSTIYGVATARLASNHTGAQILVKGHLEEARKAGATEVEALSMLLSAAVVAICDEMALRAAAEGTTTMNLLTKTAIAHAAALEPS